MTRFQLPPAKAPTPNKLPEIDHAAAESVISGSRQSAPEPSARRSEASNVPQGGQEPKSAGAASPGSILDKYEGMGSTYFVPDARTKPAHEKVTAQINLRLTPGQAVAVEEAFRRSGQHYKSQWLRKVFFRGLAAEEKENEERGSSR